MKNYISIFVMILITSSAWAGEVTVDKTISQIASSNKWETKNFYDSFYLNSVVKVTAIPPISGRTNGYYISGDGEWRMYQNRADGEFKISVAEGFTLKSICIYYEELNEGTLSTIPVMFVPDSNQVVSGQVMLVNDTAITLYVGNLIDRTGGQARITRFVVVYGDSGAQIEAFSKVSQPKNNDNEVDWSGDFADWKVKKSRRGTNDVLCGGQQATWTKSGGYMKTTNAEGGIKQVQFQWRQFVNDEVVLELALAADSLWRDTAYMKTVSQFSQSSNLTYAKAVGVKQNVQLSLSNITNDSVGEADRYLIGDIFITPYIFFPKAARSISVCQREQYFNAGSLLVDNTEGEGEIVFSIVADSTHAAVIDNAGMVDLSAVTTDGDVYVRASWNNGKVYTQMKLQVYMFELEDAFVETLSSMSFTDQPAACFIAGDEGRYGWNLTNCARSAADMISGRPGVRICYDGSLAMNGEQEGGIKYLGLAWRAADAAQAVKFAVEVDNKKTNFSYSAVQVGDREVFVVMKPKVTHNTNMALYMTGDESAGQSQIIVGDVYITPYLLFRKSTDTLCISESSVYPLDSVLINNLDTGAPTYSIVSDPTGNAYINKNELVVVQATSDAVVTVQAKWHDITTTMAILVQVSTDLQQTSLTPNKPCTKILQNGRLWIMMDGKRYSVLGNQMD